MDIINRKSRNNRQIGRAIDIINVVLAIVIVLSVIMLIIDVEKYMIMFPVVFLSSAIMNIALGIKVQKMRETMHGIIFYFVGAAMFAFAILGFLVAL